MIIKFWVSGRNFPGKHISDYRCDPYYIVYLSEDGGETKNEVGVSDTKKNQLNPDWADSFEIQIDRNKNQYLFFHVLDANSTNDDKTIGRVWVNLADYVKKGQNDNPTLDKAGYLIITNADGAVGSGMLRMPYGPYGTPDRQTLKFQVSAKGLPSEDDQDFVPMKEGLYVKLAVREGPTGPTKEIGRTSIVPYTSDPTWSDVITLEWVQDNDQRLRISFCDDDQLHSGARRGQTWFQMNDYVAKEELHTVLLHSKGSVTIKKA
ncbi:unnamed protein product [Orchesella dallaii]|uniref:C2 domain-containing protein n=1 Tax=Orchesella dallaii TaxID=48710 RepID=A0ABP1S8F9_9HEXA